MDLTSGTGKILVVDNFDSFTYNLVHYLEELWEGEVIVIRNDEPWNDALERASKVLISPGPGLPVEAGNMMNILRDCFDAGKDTLGVCLGLQAIIEQEGGKLLNLPRVYHGVESEVQVIAPDILFDGIPTPFTAGRYHSWAADPDAFPVSLQVTALSTTGEIMAIRHKFKPVRGVQFHPESVMTTHGKKIISNWLRST